MSGGHFDYQQFSTASTFEGQWRDPEIDELFHDLFSSDISPTRGGGLANALDLWLSADWSEERYRDTVRAFKEKWFKGDRKARMEELLDKRLDEVRREFEQAW